MRWFCRLIVYGVVFVVAVLAMLHVASCKSDSDTFYGLEGTVLDETSLLPIDSARIVLNSSAVGHDTNYTNTAGRFRFMTPESDDLRIVVSKQGYVTFDTTFLRIRADKENWIIGLEPNSR
jgi:hypothetical protein